MEIRKILLVDDDEDIRTIGEISLRDVGGWDIELAATGEEALKKAKVFRPDVILMDVMMPEMDGPDTCRKLWDDPELHSIPVLFLTATHHRDEVERLKALGALGVLAKPFDPMELPERIREFFV